MNLQFQNIKATNYIFILVILSLAMIACGGGSKSSPNSSAIPVAPYKVIDLGVGYAGDINELGHVTGVSDGQAYIFDGVNKNIIGTISSGTVSPDGINNNGEVVATYRPTGSISDTSVAYYNGTTWSLLGKFSGEFAWPNDINDSGQIAGTYKPVGSGNRAFIYTASNFTVIPISASAYNESYEINKNGMVSGTYLDSNNIYRSFIYDGTNVIIVPTLADPRIRPTYARGLNDRADLVGKASDASYTSRAFIYTASAVSTLNAISSNSIALDINNKNVIVGTLNENVTSDNRAFIYDGTEVQDLTDLVGNQMWTFRTATHINDMGMIIGQGLINNETHGYLLIPQ